MFLKDGKNYYPFEISKIVGKDEKKVIYDRNERGKPYFYVSVNTGGNGER